MVMHWELLDIWTLSIEQEDGNRPSSWNAVFFTVFSQYLTLEKPRNINWYPHWFVVDVIIDTSIAAYLITIHREITNHFSLRIIIYISYKNTVDSVIMGPDITDFDWKWQYQAVYSCEFLERPSTGKVFAVRRLFKMKRHPNIKAFM